MLDTLKEKLHALVAGRDPLGFDLAIDLGASGFLHLAGREAPMMITEERLTAATTLVISADDLQVMIDGHLNPMQAFMSGKLNIEGDLGRALSLGALFQ